MTTSKKAAYKGPKIERDPDNPQTLILDRWPTREEKEGFARESRRIRREGK